MVLYQDENMEYISRIMLYNSQSYPYRDRMDVYSVCEGNIGLSNVYEGSFELDNGGFEGVSLIGYVRDSDIPYHVYVGITLNGSKYIVECVCEDHEFFSLEFGEKFTGSYCFIRYGETMHLVREFDVEYDVAKRVTEASRYYTGELLVSGHVYRGFDESVPWMIYVGELAIVDQALVTRANEKRYVFLGCMTDPLLMYDTYRRLGFDHVSVLLRDDDNLNVDVDMTELNGWDVLDVSGVRDYLEEDPRRYV